MYLNTVKSKYSHNVFEYVHNVSGYVQNVSKSSRNVNNAMYTESAVCLHYTTTMTRARARAI